jgi:hypothetical protein
MPGNVGGQMCRHCCFGTLLQDSIMLLETEGPGANLIARQKRQKEGAAVSFFSLFFGHTYLKNKYFFRQ